VSESQAGDSGMQMRKGEKESIVVFFLSYSACINPITLMLYLRCSWLIHPQLMKLYCFLGLHRFDQHGSNPIDPNTTTLDLL
jgi:hypothetical protein